MITLLDIKRTSSISNMRLELLADSKEDTLPVNVSDVTGLTGGGKIKALRGANTIMTDADSVTVKSGADLLRAKKIAMLLGE